MMSDAVPWHVLGTQIGFNRVFLIAPTKSVPTLPGFCGKLLDSSLLRPGPVPFVSKVWKGFVYLPSLVVLCPAKARPCVGEIIARYLELVGPFTLDGCCKWINKGPKFSDGIRNWQQHDAKLRYFSLAAYYIQRSFKASYSRSIINIMVWTMIYTSNYACELRVESTESFAWGADSKPHIVLETCFLAPCGWLSKKTASITH